MGKFPSELGLPKNPQVPGKLPRGGVGALTQQGQHEVQGGQEHPGGGRVPPERRCGAAEGLSMRAARRGEAASPAAPWRQRRCSARLRRTSEPPGNTRGADWAERGRAGGRARRAQPRRGGHRSPSFPGRGLGHCGRAGVGAAPTGPSLQSAPRAHGVKLCSLAKKKNRKGGAPCPVQPRRDRCHSRSRLLRPADITVPHAQRSAAPLPAAPRTSFPHGLFVEALCFCNFCTSLVFVWLFFEFTFKKRKCILIRGGRRGGVL